MAGIFDVKENDGENTTRQSKDIVIRVSMGTSEKEDVGVIGAGIGSDKNTGKELDNYLIGEITVARKSGLIKKLH